MLTRPAPRPGRDRPGSSLSRQWWSKLCSCRQASGANQSSQSTARRQPRAKPRLVNRRGTPGQRSYPRCSVWWASTAQRMNVPKARAKTENRIRPKPGGRVAGDRPGSRLSGDRQEVAYVGDAEFRVEVRPNCVNRPGEPCEVDGALHTGLSAGAGHSLDVETGPACH